MALLSQILPSLHCKGDTPAPYFSIFSSDRPFLTANIIRRDIFFNVASLSASASLIGSVERFNQLGSFVPGRSFLNGVGPERLPYSLQSLPIEVVDTRVRLQAKKSVPYHIE